MYRVLITTLFLSLSSTALGLTPFNLPWMNHPSRDIDYVSTDHPRGIFVLEFLANYCKTCNDNAVNVAALATAYGDEARVQVLDVAIDRNDREIASWIRKHQPNHPVLKDVERKIWTQVGERYIPTVVVLDCLGRELLRHTGAWDTETQTKIRTVIDEQLQHDCYNLP